MNKLLKTMDDQMVKWVSELDKLHMEKAQVEESIEKLEQLIAKARAVAKEISKEISQEQ